MLPVSAAFGYTALLFAAPSVFLWMGYGSNPYRRYHPAVFVSAIGCTSVLFLSAIASIWLQVWGI